MTSALTKKVCLITPGHIASNPRLVKEAQSLAVNGYAVHLIFTQYVDYLIGFDQVILKNNPTWTYHFLDRTSKNIKIQLRNYKYAAIQKVCLMLLLQGKKSDFILAHAINRYFSWEFKKALEVNADLYIAHNLAALPVAVFAAKKTKSKCGFDAEDFHRNEISDNAADFDVQLKTLIEECLIPQTDYLTTSSPDITKLYQQLFPSKKIVTILNAFSMVKEVQLPIAKANQALKLFWFSQSIGLNRGLQDVLSAIKLLENEQIELHLLGFLDDRTSINLQELITGLQFKHKPVIVFHQPIHSDKLPVFASQFDVGLALEPGFCLNNNVALSNKIFTYVQAGLAVVASDTIAQKRFIEENQDLGFCYEKGNAQQLAAVFKRFADEPDLLQKTKQEAFTAARNDLNWETESRKFLEIVKDRLLK